MKSYTTTFRRFSTIIPASSSAFTTTRRLCAKRAKCHTIRRPSIPNGGTKVTTQRFDSSPRNKTKHHTYVPIGENYKVILRKKNLVERTPFQQHGMPIAQKTIACTRNWRSRESSSSYCVPVQSPSPGSRPSRCPCSSGVPIPARSSMGCGHPKNAGDIGFIQKPRQ